MSKDCLPHCPRIQAAIENYPEDQSPAVAVAEIIEACAETYACPGPVISEVDVIVGNLRKRTISETRYTCGLDNETS